MTENRRSRCYECDFIRIICTIGIVVYHISCGLLNTDFRPLYMLGSSAGGSVFTTAFFVLSGAMLYYKDAEVSNLKQFYYKRWKAIFPMFYLAFICCYVINVVERGSIFYNGNPETIVLSLLGLDGYFAYNTVDYFIVGEWFLGAIILLYVLYPLLAKGFEKSAVAVMGIVTILYIITVIWNPWRIHIDGNLITCLFRFTFGMFVTKFRLAEKKAVGLVSAILFVILYFSPLTENPTITYLMGFCLYFILFWIGRFLLKYIRTSVLQYLSQLTYPVFLIHHVIVNWILTFHQPMKAMRVLILNVLIVIYVFINALGLHILTNALLHSNLYLKFEAFLDRKTHLDLCA